MASIAKTLQCAVLLGCLITAAGSAAADEPVTESVTIKMVLKNNQVRFIRQADGETVSLKLTEAQKKLIRLQAPTFKGQIIRISTKHLKQGTNKISLMIIKPTSSTPLLRVLEPNP